MAILLYNMSLIFSLNAAVTVDGDDCRGGGRLSEYHEDRFHPDGAESDMASANNRIAVFIFYRWFVFPKSDCLPIAALLMWRS